MLLNLKAKTIVGNFELLAMEFEHLVLNHPGQQNDEYFDEYRQFLNSKNAVAARGGELILEAWECGFLQSIQSRHDAPCDAIESEIAELQNGKPGPSHDRFYRVCGFRIPDVNCDCDPSEELRPFSFVLKAGSIADRKEREYFGPPIRSSAYATKLRSRYDAWEFMMLVELKALIALAKCCRYLGQHIVNEQNQEPAETVVIATSDEKADEVIDSTHSNGKAKSTPKQNSNDELLEYWERYSPAEKKAISLYAEGNNKKPARIDKVVMSMPKPQRWTGEERLGGGERKESYSKARLKTWSDGDSNLVIKRAKDIGILVKLVGVHKLADCINEPTDNSTDVFR